MTHRPAHPAGSPPTVTTDFRQEFEADTRSLFRRRFQWFTGMVSLVGGLFIVASISTAAIVGSLARADLAEGESSGFLHVSWTMWQGMLVGLLSVGAYLSALLYVRKSSPPLTRVQNLAFGLVVFDGVLHITLSLFHIPPAIGMWGVLITHMLACSFLPWTPVQAAKPLLPLLGYQAIKLFVLAPLRLPEGEEHSYGVAFIYLMFSLLAGMPGVSICYLRQSRRLEDYRVQFLQRRYGEVRRELVDARRIHEALFPRPISEGPVRFRYLYEPMRQIGGDYLFVCRSPATEEHGGRLNVVLLDVTGHGIAAALTVNRLYGELQRVYAEDPDASPGDVLALLNRYVHLTLANHSVFATALCISIDPAANTLRCASGGHPPAFVKASDSTIHELCSTTFVLGACADADFEHGQVSAAFGPGDTLIAYTDGAIEARGQDGRMLGIKGLQRLLASPKPAELSWPDVILRTIESFRDGPPEDDTLVVEVTRPIDFVPARPAAANAVTRIEVANAPQPAAINSSRP